jgi:hypothetical protein
MSHHKRLFDASNPPAKNDSCPATIWCRTLLRIGVAEALLCYKSRPKQYTMQHYIDHIAEDYEIFLMEAMGRVTQGEDGTMYRTLY